MKSLVSWRLKFGLWCLFICLIFLLRVTSITPVVAQSNALTNAEVSNLRTRVNRLEQEVNRLSNFNSRNNISPPPPQQTPRNTGNPPIVNGRAIGRSDPLYERLATLLVELKEDVRDLDRRIAEIEKQR